MFNYGNLNVKFRHVNIELEKIKIKQEVNLYVSGV